MARKLAAKRPRVQPGTKRILWIEDEPRVVRYHAQHLETELGCHVEWAESVADAMSSVLRHRPDLAILDLRLPVGADSHKDPGARRALQNLIESQRGPEDAGVSLLQWIRGRKETANLPVLVFSGYGDVRTVSSVQKDVYTFHVSKPCDVDDFVALCREALGDSRADHDGQAATELNIPDEPPPRTGHRESFR